MERLHLSAGTHGERHAVTSQLLDVLGRIGAVEDTHQHSNKEMSIEFSIGADRAATLLLELGRLPLRLSDSSVAALTALPDGQTAAGWFVLTFVHREPDLRITAPAVPG